MLHALLGNAEASAIPARDVLVSVRPLPTYRARGSADERLQEIQQGKKLLFDEFARESEAKDADARAVDAAEHRLAVLDDRAVPLERRVVLAEEHRLSGQG